MEARNDATPTGVKVDFIKGKAKCLKCGFEYPPRENLSSGTLIWTCPKCVTSKQGRIEG